MNKSTDLEYRRMNKQGFQYQFPRGRWRAQKAYLCCLCYWQWSCVYFMPLWTSSLRCCESVWYHPSQIWGLDPTTQQPSGHCGINLCLPENRIDLQVLSKQPSLPALHWETGSNNMTWTTSDTLAAQKTGIAKGLPLWNTERKCTESERQKSLLLWGCITVLPVIPKYKKYNFPFKHNM